MQSKTSLRREESRITEEHLQIRGLLDRMKSVEDPGVLLLLLRDLGGMMERHFAREEGADGIYAIVDELAPEFNERTEHLVAEHGDLTERVRNLIGQCNACIAGPVARIRQDLNELYDRIQRHDVAESEVLTNALLKENVPD